MLPQLQQHRSLYATSLEQALSSVAQSAAEARVVCCWLEPLVPYFEVIHPSPSATSATLGGGGAGGAGAAGSSALSVAEFPDLMTKQTFVALFHLLWLLWKHDDVYGTNARVGGLMAGLSRCVVLRAIQYASLPQLLLLDPAEALRRLAEVGEVCAEFKAAYFSFRARVTEWSAEIEEANARHSELVPSASLRAAAQSNRPAALAADVAASAAGSGVETSGRMPGTPMGASLRAEPKDWSVPHTVIFSVMDTFLERCQDVASLAELRSLLAGLAAHDSGPVVADLTPLKRAVTAAVSGFQEKMLNVVQCHLRHMLSFDDRFHEQVVEVFRAVANMQMGVAAALLDYVDAQPICAAVLRRTTTFFKFFQKCMSTTSVAASCQSAVIQPVLDDVAAKNTAWKTSTHQSHSARCFASQFPLKI